MYILIDPVADNPIWSVTYGRNNQMIDDRLLRSVKQIDKQTHQQRRNDKDVLGSQTFNKVTQLK